MPVTLRASSIGSLAAQALRDADSEIIGQVLNTFPNSFYVKTLDGELLFVTNHPLKSPITVNVEDTSGLNQLVKPLDQVRLRGREINAGRASIDLQATSRYQSEAGQARRFSCGSTEIARSLRTASFLLRIVDTSQSVLDPRSFAHAGIAQFVDDGILPFRLPGMERHFHEAALKIVGLGSGFTPSGDDTLGGFLAAYNSLAPAIGRSLILLDFATLQNRSSWISARLLDYMQRLVLDEQVRSLIDSAARGDGDALILALETLLPRGHTSGVDISTGALLALVLIHDITFEEHQTEFIATSLGLSPSAM